MMLQAIKFLSIATVPCWSTSVVCALHSAFMLVIFCITGIASAQEPAHPSLLLDKSDIAKLRRSIKSILNYTVPNNSTQTATPIK